MRFSRRTEWDTAENDLARVHRELLTGGSDIADLTVSNPTRCGFRYPANLLDPLSGSAAFDYDPDPRGSYRARQAVCAYYAARGLAVDPANVILTTSTSEAYGYVFKLLCDPWDEILVPQPSYPLFDFLAGSEMVKVAPAPLVYDHGWQLDLEGLRRQINAKSRAVVVVHPNNPTGHFTRLNEAIELGALCREHDLAMIVDEVFLDYDLDSLGNGSEEALASDRNSFLSRHLGVPVFVVSGVSKVCALPQMKAAWLVASGPGSAEAMARLEVIADTYLSMNAPVQQALPQWLAEREGLQSQIRERTRNNLAELDRLLKTQPAGQVLANRLQVEGGWYAILRIPATQPDEVTVRQLLQLPGGGVWVHPGYFFGMSEPGRLVVSLLCDSLQFSAGISRLLGFLSGIV